MWGGVRLLPALLPACCTQELLHYRRGSRCGHDCQRLEQQWCSLPSVTLCRRKLKLAEGEESDGVGGNAESDNEALKNKRSQVRQGMFVG